MPITEAQKELRKKHIGSSDMAAILGIDPYRSAYDVYLEKTGKLPDKEPTEAMEAGTMFEDGVLQFAEKKLGPIIRNQYRVADGLPIGTNVDALIVESGQPVEAKTAGLFGPLKEGWGESDTDEVPDHVIIQSHVHLLCTQKDVCHVAAFLGGRGFNLYHVEMDKDIVNLISEKAVDFWTNNVLKDIPPENSMPSLSLIKKVQRIPEKTIDIPVMIVEEWLESKETLSKAQEEKEKQEAALLAFMRDAEAARCSLGLITYKEQTRKGYVVQDSKFRVLRLKKI